MASPAAIASEILRQTCGTRCEPVALFEAAALRFRAAHVVAHHGHLLRLTGGDHAFQRGTQRAAALLIIDRRVVREDVEQGRPRIDSSLYDVRRSSALAATIVYVLSGLNSTNVPGAARRRR